MVALWRQQLARECGLDLISEPMSRSFQRFATGEHDVMNYIEQSFRPPSTILAPRHPATGRRGQRQCCTVARILKNAPYIHQGKLAVKVYNILPE